MSNIYETIDFTVSNEYNHDYDCHLICGNKTYMCNKNILNKINYFNTYFEGGFVKIVDKKIVCKFDNKYSKLIPILLTSLYTNKIIENYRIIQLINFYDYIGWIDTISKMINNINYRLDKNVLEYVLDYIYDKKEILIGLDYNKIYECYISTYKYYGSYVKYENYDKTKLNLDNLELETIDHPILYIKYIKHLHKKIGKHALYNIRFEIFKGVNSYMRTDVKKYINGMNWFCPVRNYLIVGYLNYINANNTDDKLVDDVLECL